MKALDLLIILLFEIQDHRYCGSGISLFKFARVRTHIKPDIAHLIGLMVSVTRHNYCAFEFIDDGFVHFLVFRCLISETLAFVVETFNLLINKLEAIVDGKILRDVVDNKIESSLEDPRRCEESWPGLNSIIKGFCFRTHEESWIAADLT